MYTIEYTRKDRPRKNARTFRDSTSRGSITCSIDRIIHDIDYWKSRNDVQPTSRFYSKDIETVEFWHWENGCWEIVYAWEV